LRLQADFNGLFGDILCLSHSDTSLDENGAIVELRAGLVVTAFDQDLDDNGERDDLVATGIVERSPWNLRCLGSKWVLKIDSNGVRHESDVRANAVDWTELK
jgi:hypothetical protein